MRAEDAAKLVDFATSPSNVPWYSRWRGRLGLTAEQVKAAYAARPAAKAKDKLDEPRQALGDAVELVFKTHEGGERRVTGYEGESLMVRRVGRTFRACRLSLTERDSTHRRPPGDTTSLRSSRPAAATASARRATS